MTLGELFYRRACLIHEGYTNSLEFDAMFEADTDLGHAWCRELWQRRLRDFDRNHINSIKESEQNLQELKQGIAQGLKDAGKKWNDPVSNPEKIPNFRLYTAREIRKRWDEKRKE